MIWRPRFLYIFCDLIDHLIIYCFELRYYGASKKIKKQCYAEMDLKGPESTRVCADVGNIKEVPLFIMVLVPSWRSHI